MTTNSERPCIAAADLQNALWAAAAEVPWQHNRDQAAAVICAFFGAFARLPGAPTEELNRFAAEIDAVRAQPDWRPERPDDLSRQQLQLPLI